MSENDPDLAELRSHLTRLLAKGLSPHPAQHARQVAEIAGILHRAFQRHGCTVIMVGGSAIEVHAPGIYTSGDIDVVIERARTTGVDKAAHVFESLGLEHQARHWRHGDLFVEIVSGPVAGPTEEVEVGDAVFRVVRKEVPLRDRIVGFKHWRHTGYGDQAIAMLTAFGDDLDMTWLEPELAREGARDALEALQSLAKSDVPVTHDRLQALIDKLHRSQ
jgi:hypothetical protein